MACLTVLKKKAKVDFASFPSLSFMLVAASDCLLKESVKTYT